LQVWVFGADAVHAEDLAGHLETRHLVAAVFGQHVGLEEAGADGKDRFEGVAGAIQVWPRFSLRPPPISLSSRPMSTSDKPKGRQSSRRLHCEQATFSPGVIRGITFCLTFACTLDALPVQGTSLTFINTNRLRLRHPAHSAQLCRAVRMCRNFPLQTHGLSGTHFRPAGDPAF
jgi:hypothetical protein